MINNYLTKNAPAFITNRRGRDETVAMLKFRPASETEIKALGDNLPDGYVAGWASTPDIDLYRHVVQEGAFSESIRKRGIVGPKGIKLLIGHDWDKVGGVIKVLEYRGDSLWIEAQLNLNISYARDAWEACKMQGGLNFSVGFMLQDYSFKEDDDGNYEYLLIERGDLFEVSIVPFPGNEECTMDFVKARQNNRPVATIAEFEKSLVAKGLCKCRNDARKITQEVKLAAALFGKEASPDPVSDEPPVIEPEVVEPPAPEVKTAPVLDAEKLNTLTALVSQMKQALTPVR